MGADTGFLITIGQRVSVRLTEATPVTGGLQLELLTIDDKPLPRGGSRSPAGRSGGKRKQAKVKRKNDKIKRKVVRKRK